MSARGHTRSLNGEAAASSASDIETVYTEGEIRALRQQTVHSRKGDLDPILDESLLSIAIDIGFAPHMVEGALSRFHDDSPDLIADSALLLSGSALGEENLEKLKTEFKATLRTNEGIRRSEIRNKIDTFLFEKYVKLAEEYSQDQSPKPDNFRALFKQKSLEAAKTQKAPKLDKDQQTAFANKLFAHVGYAAPEFTGIFINLCKQNGLDGRATWQSLTSRSYGDEPNFMDQLDILKDNFIATHISDTAKTHDEMRADAQNFIWAVLVKQQSDGNIKLTLKND